MKKDGDVFLTRGMAVMKYLVSKEFGELVMM